MQIRQHSQPDQSYSGKSGTPSQPDQSCSGKSGKPLSLINPAQAVQAIMQTKEVYEKSTVDPPIPYPPLAFQIPKYKGNCFSE